MKALLKIALCSLSFTALAEAQGNGPLNRRVEDPIPRDMDNMYVKGLKYLARSQQADGSWGSASTYSNYPGTVGLCMLSFLAHGDDPNSGPYAKNIKGCINYLLSKQQKNGYIGSSRLNDTRGNMYNHGFATLALAEAYGMVDDKRLGKALEKAVALIVTSQKNNRLGAWRYSPTADDADSTVAGCQIVALYAARNAGIKVPEEAFTKGLKYMDKCRNKSDGSYGYTSPSGGKPTLTAIGSLCDSLAKKQDTALFTKSFKYLQGKLSHRESTYPYYWEYYMSQALFHGNEAVWKEWNKQNIRFMKALQKADGSIDGRKGKAFSTGASLLSLALNYRFLPIYEK